MKEYKKPYIDEEIIKIEDIIATSISGPQDEYSYSPINPGDTIEI